MNFWIQNLIAIAGLLILVMSLLTCHRTERWQKARVRFLKDTSGLVSLGIILILFFIGWMDCVMVSAQKSHGNPKTLLDWCFSGVPNEKSYSAPLATTLYADSKKEPLRGRHLLGTDVLGKDVLLQTLKACRTALIIGGLTSLIYIPLGTILGILAGYYKRWMDDVIYYIYSTLASVPHILLLIAILMVLGKGLGQMSIALGITSWVGLCRLIRGETLRQTQRPYIEAARALGQNHRKIIFTHLLPNVMHLVIINFVLGFSGLVLAESLLSYLGVGAPVGTASWGLMIDSARMELSREPVVWWNLAASSITLFLLVLSLNLLGDALRRAFDPRAH